MHDHVEVRSFEAVEQFRAALIGFIDTANAAIGSADVEISRTINWLETEQLPHWKSMLRTSAEEIEKARTAYREKALYKDSTGARHSAIDELKALRRCEARRAEVEKRALATRRNLRQLQRERTLYQGVVQQLRGMIDGRLPLAAAELREVVEQLQRYAHVSPESPARSEEGFAERQGQGMAAPAPAPATARPEAAQADDETLRRRTPGPQVRRNAQRAGFMPILPEVPAEAVEAIVPDPPPDPPGRYDLVTTTLLPEDPIREGSAVSRGNENASGPPTTNDQPPAPVGAVYLERREPAGPGDSGWHIGPADPEPVNGPCVTITVGRLAAACPELGQLLSLPVGSLLVSRDGRLVRVIDPLGRPRWPAGEGQMTGCNDPGG